MYSPALNTIGKGSSFVTLRLTVKLDFSGHVFVSGTKLPTDADKGPASSAGAAERSVDEHADNTTPAARARAITRHEDLRMSTKLAGKCGGKYSSCPPSLEGFIEPVGNY
jgi:hypothetical protein